MRLEREKNLIDITTGADADNIFHMSAGFAAQRIFHFIPMCFFHLAFEEADGADIEAPAEFELAFCKVAELCAAATYIDIEIGYGLYPFFRLHGSRK